MSATPANAQSIEQDIQEVGCSTQVPSCMGSISPQSDLSCGLERASRLAPVPPSHDRSTRFRKVYQHVGDGGSPLNLRTSFGGPDCLERQPPSVFPIQHSRPCSLQRIIEPEVMMDKASGRSRGFGFVNFTDEAMSTACPAICPLSVPSGCRSVCPSFRPSVCLLLAIYYQIALDDKIVYCQIIYN